MITLVMIALIIAVVFCVLSAVGKFPLWPSVLILLIVELFQRHIR